MANFRVAKKALLLRVFLKTVGVCHVYCNFKFGNMCQVTIVFGTLKGGSLLINILASNNCFSFRNIFQNALDALPKIPDTFVSKSSKYLSCSGYQKFASLWHEHLLRNYKWNFRHLQR